jgi:hypothetical protein
MAVQLSEEIRSFNTEIDFRLRFLHVEIEEVSVAAPEVAETLPDLATRVHLHKLEGAQRDTLAAARLALILAHERPRIMVALGNGALIEPAEAAAQAAGVKFAQFGGGAGARDGALDLGNEPAVALDRLTGVAREIG